MKRKKVLENIDKLIHDFRITSGKGFKLSSVDPAATGGIASAEKDKAKELLANGIQWLAELQDKLYAQNRWALLLVFQAMDAAGKDGTIKHVMSGINPQGCQVYSFKQPSHEELDHDYLWRYMRNTPERGRIGIFNRSYYEEVLVVRIHEEVLQKQQIPQPLLTKNIWEDRLKDIRNYESYLTRNGIIVLKFFLHVSRQEQKKRFLARLDRPEKNWKFSTADIKEREHWDKYMRAYEEAIKGTASPHSPWYVVPADNKWFTRLVVAAAVVETLENLDLEYPTVSEEQKKELIAARDLLSQSNI